MHRQECTLQCMLLSEATKVVGPFVIATNINIANTYTYFYVLQREIYTFFNSGKRRKKTYLRGIYSDSLFNFKTVCNE